MFRRRRVPNRNAYVPVVSAEPYGFPREQLQRRKGADPCHVEPRAHYPVVRELFPPTLLLSKSHAVSRQRLVELPVEVRAGLVFVPLVVESVGRGGLICFFCFVAIIEVPPQLSIRWILVNLKDGCGFSSRPLIIATSIK